MAAAHGSGSVIAMDRRTGELIWSNRAPNWVHNDPVIVNGVVAVGFGNKEQDLEEGRFGSPPSGIVAFDAQSGIRRWIHFFDGPAMTALASDGKLAFAATGDGFVLGIDVRDGSIRWRRKVPGFALMANPATVDSTLVVSLEPNVVCSLRTTDGSLRWCSSLPGYFATAGEGSPAISDSLVFATAVEDSTFDILVTRGSIASAASHLFRWIIDTRSRHKGSQVLIALRRRNGSVAWVRNLGSGPKALAGNVAGTPVLSDGSVFVIGPLGRTLSRFEESGRLSWQVHDLKGSRGAPLVYEGHVVVFGLDSTLRVYNTTTGLLECEGDSGMAVDRAGPVVVGASTVTTSVAGDVRSRPLTQILRCSASTR